MATTPPAPPAKRYVRTSAASEYSGMPESTLAKRRMRGDDPEYIKIGAAIYYDLEVLDRLMATRRRRSTSERGRDA